MSKDGQTYKPDKVKMSPQNSTKKKVVRKKPVKKVVSKKAVAKKTIPKKTVPPKPTKNIPEKEPEPDVQEEVPAPKKQTQRKKVTLESHNQKFDELLALMDNEIKRKSREKEKGTRTLQKMRKMIRELKNETTKIANSKRRRSGNGNRVSGFMKRYKINAEGAAFLQVDKGTLLSRRELTNAICVYAHYNPNDKREQMKRWKYLNPEGKRDLQKEGKRMIIEPDDVLSKLLKYEDYKRDVKEGKIMKTVTEKDVSGGKKTTKNVQDDDALYYRVIQKLINNLFEKE